MIDGFDQSSIVNEANYSLHEIDNLNRSQQSFQNSLINPFIPSVKNKTSPFVVNSTQTFDSPSYFNSNFIDADPLYGREDLF